MGAPTLEAPLGRSLGPPFSRALGSGEEAGAGGEDPRPGTPPPGWERRMQGAEPARAAVSLAVRPRARVYSLRSAQWLQFVSLSGACSHHVVPCSVQVRHEGDEGLPKGKGAAGTEARGGYRAPTHPARRAERAFGARRRAAMPEGRCAPSASRCCRGPGVRL